MMNFIVPFDSLYGRTTNFLTYTNIRTPLISKSRSIQVQLTTTNRAEILKLGVALLQ